jgi:hypothetical protein
VAAVLPAAAGASDYCLDTGCGGTNVQSFEQALDQADNATDADRIFLGDGTYTAPTMTGVRYDRSDAPVEIIGQGTGRTILTSPAGGSARVLRAGRRRRQLRSRPVDPAAAERRHGARALDTSNAARRIEVAEDQTQSSQRTAWT